MCLLTFLPPGQQPDLDALITGAAANPDGHGFALVDRDRIVVSRSKHAEDLLEQFGQVRTRFPDGPALFHSRLATHGRTTTANCHPFRLGGDRRTVLAHNGILPNIVQPQGRQQRSDTRITAEDYIPTRFGALTSHRARRRLAHWMGSSNKMVILTINPAYSRTSYNEHAGIWDTGTWYSNTDYQPDPVWPPIDRWDHAWCDGFCWDTQHNAPWPGECTTDPWWGCGDDRNLPGAGQFDAAPLRPPQPSPRLR